jgi:hypothetical protein
MCGLRCGLSLDSNEKLLGFGSLMLALKHANVTIGYNPSLLVQKMSVTWVFLFHFPYFFDLMVLRAHCPDFHLSLRNQFFFSQSNKKISIRRYYSDPLRVETVRTPTQAPVSKPIPTSLPTTDASDDPDKTWVSVGDDQDHPPAADPSPGFASHISRISLKICQLWLRCVLRRSLA